MRSKIDSVTNKKIKLAVSLRQRKYREKEGLFLAEGVRLCEMAVDSGWKISFGLYSDTAMGDTRAVALLDRLDAQGCHLYSVPEKLLARACPTEHPQGILLVMEQKRIRFDALVPAENSLLIVLDGIQDPGNAGSIIRTADAAGAQGVILLEGSVDAFADKTVRATMGSIFHVPILEHAARKDFLNFIRKEGIRLYATTLDASAQAYCDADFHGRAAIIFGNEANGVKKDLLDAAKKICIPMPGKAESLNAAAAAAIVTFEALRQRNCS